ncbi:MAG TPA: GIY-YIG nuclease family protein [Patescibacteria group bacterium]|nr:GIY-YIG nuclease family protein [Patescibacteria group bacterium]
MDDWIVYIARTESGHLYTGISNDVPARIIKHNSGKGAKFARMHGALTLVYQSEAMFRSDALKREAEIKSWDKTKKEELVRGA